MPVYDDHKLVFHHVPKTGGRAIDRWLGGADSLKGHVAVWISDSKLRSRAFSGEGYRLGFPSFTIVRDPVDRIRSGWMHHKREGRATLAEWPHLFDCSFEGAVLHDDFAKLLHDDMRSVHFYPLSWMFSKKGGSLFLPHLSLDFNNLERDTSLLVERFSLDVDPFIFSPTQYDRRPLSSVAMEKFKWLYRSDYDIIPHLSGRSIALA